MGERTNGLWQVAGRQLAPIVDSPAVRHRQLPPFSKLTESCPPPRMKLPPPRTVRPTVNNRPPSRGRLSAARLAPSSPLVQCMDPYESPRSSLDGHSSFEELAPRTLADHGRSSIVATPAAGSTLENAADQLQPSMLSPPMSPPSPSPDMPSPTSEPSSSTSTPNTISYAAYESAVAESCASHSFPDYVDTLVFLDLQQQASRDKAREDLDSLFGIKADPVQIKLESLRLRRKNLLAEWGVDHQTCLDDHSLEKYSRRCEIVDIDNQLRMFSILR